MSKKPTWERRQIHPRLAKLRQDLKNQLNLTDLKEADLLIEQLVTSELNSRKATFSLGASGNRKEARISLYGSGIFK